MNLILIRYVIKPRFKWSEWPYNQSNNYVANIIHFSSFFNFNRLKNGNPGFFSEKNGKPDNLFHISFEDNPGHPYAQYLLNNVDLEEYELVDLLLPQEEEKKTSAGGDIGGSAKKRRRRS